MTERPKVKLCWNCEGRVSFREENCPLCGVYLSPSAEADIEEEEEAARSAEFAPPYQISGTHDPIDAPYKNQEQVTAKVAEAPKEEESLTSEMKLVILTLALLSGGALFLLFGFVLLLFSQDGFFTLQWNGAYWYAYLVAGVSMLFFGWRALERFGSDE